MAETLNTEAKAKPVEPQGEEEEPGLLDTVGSFPVWMLKAIQAATPDFLVSKTPPKKKKVRI